MGWCAWHLFSSSSIINTTISPFYCLVRKEISHCISFFFFPVSPLPQWLHLLVRRSTLAPSVNAANSILKCVCRSPKPLRVPPLCLHAAPSLLICRGVSCVGRGKSWMLRQTNATVTCSGTHGCHTKKRIPPFPKFELETPKKKIKSIKTSQVNLSRAIPEGMLGAEQADTWI